MSNSFTFYTLLAILGCLGTGTICAWLLYGQTTILTIPLSRTLAVLRAVTVSLILWLLFSPLIRQLTYTSEKPVIVIAQDNSLSVGPTEDMERVDSKRYREAMLRLQADLGQKYDIKSYSFGERITDSLLFSFSDRFTNASMLSEKLRDELLNRNVGAVILATDGLFNKGGNPAADLAELKAPVYTIALGDTVPKKDLIVAGINHNDIVYRDHDFRIEVLLQGYHCAGQSTKLSVIENGKVLYEEVVPIIADNFALNKSILLHAGPVGGHHYTVALSSLEGEFSMANNRLSFVVDVIDRTQKILIAANSPHPDLSALRTAINQDIRYDVSVVTGAELKNVNLTLYGLVILHQVPGALTPDSFIDKLSKISVPLWYIAGAQTEAEKLNRSQKAINFAQNGNGLQYISNHINPGLSAFELDEPSRRAILQFDPLQVPALEIKPREEIQSVISQVKGRIQTGEPLLFFSTEKGRKLGFLLGEGLWRWKLSEAAKDPTVPNFTLLVQKIIQYLSVTDDKKKFVARPVQQTFDENEHVIIDASLYNDSYDLVNRPEATIQVKNAEGRLYLFSFSRYKDKYRLDGGILPPGYYTYVASTVFNSRKYVDKGAFVISTFMAELQQTAANHHMLYQLSSETSGSMYRPDEIKKLKEDLMSNKKIKILSYEDRRYEELINFRWIAGLLVLLLSTEWFLRKRNGAV